MVTAVVQNKLDGDHGLRKDVQQVAGPPDAGMPLHGPMRTTPVANCPLCGWPGSVLYEHLVDRALIVAGRWSGRQCGNSGCGTYWLDPMPIEEDIHKAYATYYTHTNGHGNLSWASKRENLALGIIRGIERLWLKALFLAAERDALETMFLAGLPAGRVLEIGCGSGSLLRRLHDLGWETEGQDIDPNAASFGSDDIIAHLGELKALALPSESYDAVIMNHVIEHVHHPVELLRECHRIAKPGAVLVIATPNVNSYGHKRFCDAWAGLQPPRHLQIFSPKSLITVANAAGWLSQEGFTTAARAGGNGATSRDTRRTGIDQMGARKSVSHLLFAAWYQFAARINHMRHPEGGEEIVLIARK